jgi:membrane protein implicated in regulation of membrane protease activity
MVTFVYVMEVINMEIHPEPQTHFSIWLLPLLSGLFYVALVLFIVYVGVKLLKFMKRKEERDEQIINKLNTIMDKIEK